MQHGSEVGVIGGMNTLLVTCTGPRDLADVVALHLEAVGASTAYVGPAHVTGGTGTKRHLMVTTDLGAFDHGLTSMLRDHPTMAVNRTTVGRSMFVSVTVPCTTARI